MVIPAGHTDRMRSRIAHHIKFGDHELDELIAIARLMSDGEGYRLSGAAAGLRERLRQQMPQPRFANARSARNALERARSRHASRLLESTGRCGAAEPTRSEAPDFSP